MLVAQIELYNRFSFLTDGLNKNDTNLKKLFFNYAFEMQLRSVFTSPKIERKKYMIVDKIYVLLHSI